MAVSWSLKRTYDFTENFQSILRFYVIDCPIEGVSVRYRNSQVKENTPAVWKRSMMALSGLNETTWQIKSTSDLEAALSDFGVLHSFDPKREFAFHIRSRNLNHPMALIYLIRCAFSHGSFSQRSCNDEVYYALENRHEGILKGRAVLKESTLLRWIELFKKGK